MMLFKLMFFRDESMSDYPRGHLLIATGVAILTAIPLLLFPGSETTANRVEVPIEIKVGPAQALMARTAPRRDTGPTHAPAPDTTPASLTDLPPTASGLTTAAFTPANPNVDPAPVEGPAWKNEKVLPGDSLTTIFKRLGLGPQAVHEASRAGEEAHRLRNLRPGEVLDVRLALGGDAIDELIYRRNRLESLTLKREDGVLTSEYQQRQPEVKRSYATGKIRNSLFLDASEAGLSDRKIMEMAGIFGWDIDFALDLREGDDFGVLYEERFLDGERIGEGNILAAYFTNQGQKFTAVRYEVADGEADYFAPDGESMRKAFLRTPVAFARISSHFNLRRKHPILHTIRAHKGVDYAAPRGTPIRAAGDGRVTFAGRKGGYGKTLVIQHGESYSTLYAHVQSFKRGIRSGSRVRQGQIVAYVGSSGLATGPHLHYEFRVNGVHRNPLTVKLPKSTPVPRKEMPRFMASTRDLVDQIESLRSNPIALNEQ